MESTDRHCGTAPLRVFVYGSLMRGGKYHYLMLECGGQFMGSGRLQRPYPLIQADYPRLLDRPGTGGLVEGELFSLPGEDSWLPLDALEGHPVEYCRRVEPVVCEAGILSAWAYFYVLDNSSPDVESDQSV